MSGDFSESYMRAAIDGEAASVAEAQASTRNTALNRAAFRLGTIPGMSTETAVGALMLAAGSNGYTKEHGERAARATIESGLRAGIRSQRAAPAKRQEKPRPAIPTPAGGTSKPASGFPKCTPPGFDGKPVFHAWDAGGPPVRPDEKRRHVYRSDSTPTRIKVMLRDGGAINWYRVQNGCGITGWQARKPEGYVEVPYTGDVNVFRAEAAQDEIYCPEGEKDVDTLERLGLLAITFGGTGDGAPARMEDWFAGRDVVILTDNDEGGRQHAERKAALIARTAQSVKVVHFPELPKKGDVSDWVELGHGAEDLRKRVAAAGPWQPPAGAEPVVISAQRQQLIIRRASDIAPEKLVWVWPDRIAEGKLVLLGGPPGLGKSQLTAFIAATISNGGDWPCGEGSATRGSVLFLSAEDGIEDTIVPRLHAAGADTGNVHIVAAVTKPDGTGRKTFSLKTDVALLEERAREIGDVRLIVVDPISAYMGGADSHGNAETREVLEPLADMANRLRIAVVAVTHLNKGGAGHQNALNRFAGSIAFVAAARSAFAVIEDSEDETRRLLLQAKNNLGPKCKGLAFRIEQRLIAGDILSSNIMFEGAHVDRAIDEALRASESGEGAQIRTTKDEAVDFLRDILKSGPMGVLDIEREAREAGLLGPDAVIGQSRAFRDARKKVGAQSRRDGRIGSGGRWVWELPAISTAAGF